MTPATCVWDVCGAHVGDRCTATNAIALRARLEQCGYLPDRWRAHAMVGGEATYPISSLLWG